MNYSIKISKVIKEDSNVKAFVNIVFADSFKVTNIAILENKDTKQLFVSMPRYRSNEVTESGETIYKDVANPITAEFREELYTNIIEAYDNSSDAKNYGIAKDENVGSPKFSVSVTPFEREGSNIRGLARVYIEDSFIVNNVNIIQRKEKLFVAMPAYKTKQKDDNGKFIYQDVAYPVSKEFRQELFDEIINEYEAALEKKVSETKTNNNKLDKEDEKTSLVTGRVSATPFR